MMGSVRRAVLRFDGRVRSATLALTLATALSLVASSEVSGQASSTLRILLTNEEGFRAEGLARVREALAAAGHDVVVVAPLDDRDGSGAARTTWGLIDYYPQADGVWAVNGTPADAVTLAMVHVMRADPPDLVIAGADLGHSVGADVLSSGVVGAALTASRMGVPAIALSVATDEAERDTEPAFPSSTAAYDPAAALLTDLVRQLAESSGGGLLGPRQILNVNYPAVGGASPTGVRFATVSSVRAFRQLFTVTGEVGPARVETIAASPDRAEEGSDVALLAAGYVTISVLDGDLDAGEGSWEPLLERLVIER